MSVAKRNLYKNFAHSNSPTLPTVLYLTIASSGNGHKKHIRISLSCCRFFDLGCWG